MKCLAESLSLLSGRPLTEIEEILSQYGQPPWCIGDLCYAADYLGIYLHLFPHEIEGKVYPMFAEHYAKYDGILCGDFPGREIGHAVAKIDGKLLAPNVCCDGWQGFYNEMRGKIFLAWTNKS